MIEDASLKFIIPFAVATTLALPAVAQDFGSALLMGLGTTALDKGADMLKEAPQSFDKFMKDTTAGRSYATEAACLGELQAGINAGTIMANMLPFSTVQSFEDARGPVGRFRLMVNGVRNQFDVHCDGPQMLSAALPWGDAPDQRDPTARSSFDAAAGLLLLLHMQGAFKEEAPKAVAGTSNGQTDREPSLAKTQNDSEAEAPSDVETRQSDALIDKVLADMQRERKAKEKPDVMPTKDLIADALAEVLGYPDETPSTSGQPRPKPRSQPPLSSGERHGFAQQIVPCWNIGSLSTDAASTTVVVEVQMNHDGTPVASSIRLQSYEGGSEAAGRQAFEAAKRAVIRCGGRGFDLPSEKLAADGMMLIAFAPGRTTGSMAGVTVRQIRDN